jgi:hypothetical protein
MTRGVELEAHRAGYLGSIHDVRAAACADSPRTKNAALLEEDYNA